MGKGKSSSSSKPTSIGLPTFDTKGDRNGGALSGEGKTPTQETARMNLGTPTGAAPGGEPISKRRGSDTLSIGIPGQTRSRPALGATGSLNVTPMGTPPKEDGPAPVTVKRSGTVKAGSAGTSARPPVARQNAGTSPSQSAVVSDGEDDEEERGYEGEDDGKGLDTEAESRATSPQKAFKGGRHSARDEQVSSSSSTSTISSSGTATGGDFASSAPHYQHHQNGNMAAGQNGSKKKAAPTQHSFDIHGSQPVRGESHRNHQRSNTGNSSINSSKRDKENMRPFPTPGQKEQRNPFEEEKSFEETRLLEAEEKTRHWKRWGPYLSERQWATVREDYSANGDAWTHFPHEHARSRAYRWGEDGLAGVSDNHQRLCFGLALWNGKDPILKERMFGTTGHQGNHGEDVKELYYYLDSTPTHSYMKYLYKYPQRPYPYEELVRESSQRSRDVVEYEITDTDAFDDDKYWDIFVEYAKDEDNVDGMSIRITAYNRGPEPADLHIVPQLWFRNTWSWPKERPTGKDMPNMKAKNDTTVQIDHATLGRMYCHLNESPGPIEPIKRGARGSAGGPQQPIVTEESVAPEMLFTHNDTNFQRLYGGQNQVPYVKDAFHDHIIMSHRPPLPKSEQPDNGEIIAPVAEEAKPEGKVGGDDMDPARTDVEKPPTDPSPTTPKARIDMDGQPAATAPQPPTPKWPDFVNPDKEGTKFGAHYTFKQVPANGGCCVVRLKLTDKDEHEDEACYDEEMFDEVIQERRLDADEFYSRFNSGNLTDDLRNIMRQALAGMLWNKQFYYFIQKEWLQGDPGQPPPPPERQFIRNRDWRHLHCEDILSMPDKWEYPFFAAWDTAFHCLPLAMVDPAYAKNQLMLMVREWYMKPDGALPAYEWNYSDVNPPVHAWATFRVFKIERKMYGREDLGFLEKVFQKLLMNFTWWVNRKDAGGNNVFEGGFLGLDNIGLFNRSEPLPTGGNLRQADGTAWMAFYCLNMLNMALELAKHNSTYEDIASKFFEHFLFISDAMTFKAGGSSEESLWNDEDGFYYDAISWGEGNSKQLPVRSLVGLIPLYATLTLEPNLIKKFKGFKKRMDWFIENRGDITDRNIANMRSKGKADRKLLALCSEDRLRKLLTRMLDEKEFLSDYGVRSLSRAHKENPYSMDVNGERFSVDYWPGDSHSGMFGGNSNWRGPIWLAVNALLIESLQRFHQFYGADFKVECPTGSGDQMTLANAADEIQHRIIHLFARDHEGVRACNGGSEKMNKDPHFRDHVLFHEFFHADNGKGLGASHQCGWTGLVAWFIWQSGHSARMPRTPRTPRTTAMHYFDEVIPSTPGGSEYETDFLSASELSPDEL